jgi:hypothetical protein
MLPIETRTRNLKAAQRQLSSELDQDRYVSASTIHIPERLPRSG